jgi:hypothetical protein
MGKIVGLGESAAYRAAWSYDGIEWFAATGIELNIWNGVAASNSRRILVAISGNGTNRIATSENGESWTPQAAPVQNAWTGICHSYELDLFVAVSVDGTSRVMISSDGFTWSLHTAAAVYPWRSVCWSSALKMFCAVAQSGTHPVMTSPDGVNWTLQTAAPTLPLYGVVSADDLGLFVACAYSGANQFLTSHDGINWTSHKSTPTGAWRGMVYSPYHATVISGSYILPSALAYLPITIKPLNDQGTPLITDGAEPAPYSTHSGAIYNLPGMNAAAFTWTLSVVGDEQRLTLTTKENHSVGAAICYAEVFCGLPLNAGQSWPKGPYKKAGLVPIGPSGYVSEPLIYPWSNALETGKRISVKLRVISRGCRISTWVFGVATIN